jgi:epoxyqueuosine reductase
LERDLAWAAGLGWIGKNGCLTSLSMGSLFYLAEVFFDFPIEPDSPVPQDYCGNCRRCIDACPTGCIQSDRTIDSNQCIAYHTIENKGSIPLSIRPVMGNRIFGCDTCLSVCPWNKKRVSNEEPDNPVRILENPNLLIESEMDQPAFKKRYQHTPLMRAKYRGYKRNICIALGNSRSEKAVKPLTRLLLTESEPLIRAHAAWALGNFDRKLSQNPLEKASQAEKDPEVIQEILGALHLYD